jgi:hypothetical protein
LIFPPEDPEGAIEAVAEIVESDNGLPLGASRTGGPLSVRLIRCDLGRGGHFFWTPKMKNAHLRNGNGRSSIP